MPNFITRGARSLIRAAPRLSVALHAIDRAYYDIKIDSEYAFLVFQKAEKSSEECRALNRPRRKEAKRETELHCVSRRSDETDVSIRR